MLLGVLLMGDGVVDVVDVVAKIVIEVAAVMVMGGLLFRSEE